MMNNPPGAPLEARDYRVLLQHEMIRRMDRNKAYSMRAFARDIRMSQGFLSGLLGGKKALSAARAAQVPEHLGWPERRARLFTLLVRLETIEAETEESRIRAEIEELRVAEKANVVASDLNLEYFRMIGEWYHAALLELLALDNVDHETSHLAERLSLDTETIVDALNRLCRVGLLKRAGDRWERQTEHVVIPAVPSEAIRSFHRSYLKSAAAAVELQSPPTRVLQTSLMPISPSALKKVEEKMERFTTSLIETTAVDPKQQLYCLSMAFFRVDQDPTPPASVR